MDIEELFLESLEQGWLWEPKHRATDQFVQEVSFLQYKDDVARKLESSRSEVKTKVQSFLTRDDILFLPKIGHKLQNEKFLVSIVLRDGLQILRSIPTDTFGVQKNNRYAYFYQTRYLFEDVKVMGVDEEINEETLLVKLITSKQSLPIDFKNFCSEFEESDIKSLSTDEIFEIKQSLQKPKLKKIAQSNSNCKEECNENRRTNKDNKNESHPLVTYSLQIIRGGISDDEEIWKKYVDDIEVTLALFQRFDIQVDDLEEPFTCPLPEHEDHTVQLEYVEGQIMLTHDEECDEEIKKWYLAEALASIKRGKEIIFQSDGELEQKASAKVWYYRMLYELGVINPPVIEAKALPEDDPFKKKELYQKFCLLLRLRQIHDPDQIGAPFSYRFARNWCGIGSNTTIQKHMENLFAEGYLEIKEERNSGNIIKLGPKAENRE